MQKNPDDDQLNYAFVNRSAMTVLTMGATVFTVVISLLFPAAFAQDVPTILYLDPLPSSVNTGDTIAFSGYLITADGYAVQNAGIHIKDDVSFGLDDTLGTVMTDVDGGFYGTWEAQVRDGGGAYDFYAVFEGFSGLYSARSATYNVTVSNYASGGQAQGYRHTEIILDPLPPLVYTDQTIRFTGQLTSNGYGIAGAEVSIMEDDPLVPDQELAWGHTDQNGRFAIHWDVDGGYLEVDFDIYAKFDGGDTYGHARSHNQVMSVTRHSGSISLDPIPSSARVGERVDFSGTLRLDQSSPEGAIVYIKDEDFGSRDELLATAYTEANGRFSTYWIAGYTDFDDTVDIYAVFEGGDDFARLTTCDPNPTSQIGGLCPDTLPLSIYGDLPVPPQPPSSVPPDSTTAEGGYMELYYAMNLSHNPRVAIVPDPDAYDEVRNHIVPVQEGIMMWTSLMEDRYGGSWGVDFDVIEPDEMADRPDVFVNLVTPERDQGCMADYYGWANVSYSTPAEPIQTNVCSSSGGQKRSNADVAVTAAHEFIHAMGLGHTFGIDGDMMCSVEAAGPTCPFLIPKAKVPSALNLDAVAEIYGSDGFQNPNSRFAYKYKFYAGSEDGAAIETGPAPSPPDSPAVGTGSVDFREFRTPEFSIRYPSDWDVDDKAIDLGANPGSWGSATSFVVFYDEAGGTVLEVTLYEEDDNAINNRGSTYLDVLEDRLRQACLQASYTREGFECSNYSSTGSQIRSDGMVAAYQVTATWTYTDSFGESIGVTQSLVSMPVGRNAWEAHSVTPAGTPSQQASTIDRMLASFEPADAVEDDAAGDAREAPSAGDAVENDAAGDARETPSAGDAAGDDAAGDAREAPSGGGCLIATAAYGSELAPQVQLLREIRDNMLLSTDSGISFMAGFSHLYYSFSPAVADFARENAAFKDSVRTAITPALYTLGIMTLADQNSDASVIAFGLLTIAAMAGIYVAGPILAVRAIGKRVRQE